MAYERRRHSFGPGKIAEMSGDNRKLLEVLLKSALGNDDHEEAERLRKALHSQPLTQMNTEPVFTNEVTPELKAKKSKRQQRKKPAPSSSLTREQASRIAWEELLRRRER
jgi:threonine aldolase